MVSEKLFLRIRSAAARSFVGVLVSVVFCGTCFLSGCPEKRVETQRAPASEGPNGPDRVHKDISGFEESRKEPREDLRLVVLIVADQLPSWFFEKNLSMFRHGIRRLLDAGVYYPEAVFPHAATFTAVGHATLATGARPSVSGILSNRWYHRDIKAVRSSVFDSDHKLFTLNPKEPVMAPGVSPSMLRVKTVGDMLKKHTENRGKVVAVSLKDRAAVLTGGKKADLAIWYSNQVDPPIMTTSAYYRNVPPEWLRVLNERFDMKGKLSRVWRPLASETEGAGKDGIEERQNAFEHSPFRSGNPAREIRNFPAGDRLVFKTALAAIDGEKLGKDDIPDFLAVSFSTPDYVGHKWGQESPEMRDIMMRLDVKIGRFLEELDRKVGKGSYAVVFTSDHGAPPSRVKGKRIVRVPPQTIAAAAAKGATDTAGKGRWIEAVANPYVTLTAEAMDLPEDKRNDLITGVMDSLRRVEGIGYVRRTDEISGNCDDRECVDHAFCLIVPGDAPGEIVFGVEPYYYIANYDYDIINHGSHHMYDRVVPLVVYEPGRPSGKVEKQVSVFSIASTLTRLLGVPSPPRAEAPPL